MALGRIHFDLFLSSLGTILGVAAFFTFLPFYENYEAAFLGLYSAFLALAAFMLHRAAYKDTLDRITYSGFDRREIFGFFGFVIGCGFMLFYVFLMLHKHAVPVEIVVRLVWSFMVAKWGLLLYFASRKYARSYGGGSLLDE